HQARHPAAAEDDALPPSPGEDGPRELALHQLDVEEAEVGELGAGEHDAREARAHDLDARDRTRCTARPLDVLDELMIIERVAGALGPIVLQPGRLARGRSEETLRRHRQSLTHGGFGSAAWGPRRDMAARIRDAKDRSRYELVLD